MSMDKNKIFLKTGRFSLIILLVAAFWIITKSESRQEEGWPKVLEEVVQEMMERKIFSGQFIFMDLVWEEQNSFVYWKRERITESRFPIFTEVGIMIPKTKDLKNMQKENQGSVEAKEETEEIFLTENGNFIPQKKKQEKINWQEYETLEELLKRFYTVDATAGIQENLFLLKDLRDTNLRIDKKAPGPQILLYHTHSQETFADSRPGEKEDSIIGAGKILASLLEEYGYKVLHHQGEYDIESRDYAYSNSLPAITKILEENPQIQVVIDLHRDAVQEDTKLVTEVEGKQTAKVMFFNGLSHSKEQGKISYLENPFLKENLAFSFQMKAACDEYYPGFARKIYLRAYRYNMHLCPKTLLIELGAQTNTVEEIKNALYPLAHTLDIVLSGKEFLTEN